MARARPKAPERPAEKEQLASQPRNTKATKHCKQQRFVTGRERARRKAPKPSGKKNTDRAAHEPPQQKQNKQNISPSRNITFFETVFTAFCWARNQLGPKMRHMPSVPSGNQSVVHGLRRFLGGVLMQTKPR